jgi:hypothetical protein
MHTDDASQMLSRYVVATGSCPLPINKQIQTCISKQMKIFSISISALVCAILLALVLLSVSPRQNLQSQDSHAPNEVRSEIVKELERGEEVRDRIMEILLRL